ncbi:MAG: DUF192 domain-containing protein [Blastochloris sp.]|nr:DUF192 domain-containing protein [Blastochloris sp.]
MKPHSASSQSSFRPLLGILGFVLLGFVLLGCLVQISVGQIHAGSDQLNQAALPVIELKVGQHLLKVEVASTPQSMARGLMFRRSLPPDQGMLFVFPLEHQASFWMKNTSIPLSIAYLDKEGTILEIHPLIPFREEAVQSKSNKVLYALEVNRDWFSTRQITPAPKSRVFLFQLETRNPELPPHPPIHQEGQRAFSPLPGVFRFLIQNPQVVLLGFGSASENSIGCDTCLFLSVEYFLLAYEKTPILSVGGSPVRNLVLVFPSS